MKKPLLPAFAAVVATLCCSLAFAALYPQGKISKVNVDATVTISAGQDVGFEVGDILVIQRNGRKIGLAHVQKVAPKTAYAQVVKTEPGAQPQVGDVVAYQLLKEVYSAPREEARALSNPLEPRWPVPDVIREEWKVPQIYGEDLDEIIETQHRLLEDEPHNRSAMMKIADAYFKKAWYEHAVKWYQKAIEESPSSDDNDKLIYQIIRCLGFLNMPEKQAMYIDFLQTYYPDSPFAFIDTTPGSMDEATILNLQHGRRTIVDSRGFQKGGMKYMSGGQAYKGSQPTNKLSGKLIQGSPERIEPRTYIPSMEEVMQD